MSESSVRWLWRIGIVLGLMAVLVSLVVERWPSIAGGVSGSTAGSRSAPCLPGRPVQVLDSPHIAWQEADSVRYNSTPPTSGPHFGYALATGIYDSPVPDGLTVHALEHGHVAIQYPLDIPGPTVERLRTIAKLHAADVVLAPYPGLTDGIALTAWGRIDLLDDFDEARISMFIRALAGRFEHGWTRADPC